jgi:type 2 lantibiotic biosynthesis protein LanM
MSDFTGSLGCLVDPVVSDLSAQLSTIPGLSDAERTVIRDSATTALYTTAHRRLCRVLVLELNAARISGRLTGDDSAARWAQFLGIAAQRPYWDSLGEHYPTMLARLATVLTNQCTATAAMAGRLARDRGLLARLPGCDPGELTGLSIGAGDTHRGGQSVAVLRFSVGAVVYKPRSVQVDRVLDRMLGEVLGGLTPQARIRVPAVVVRDGYGWAEHVTHRYCTDDVELSAFYTGIGHWLAVMRLLGGSDLHAENVIACGPVPVVVDCETLFTPDFPAAPSGAGLAVDQAGELIGATVLRTGMLPNRGIALGWRGVDASAVGSLPGQQPVGQWPVLVDGGSDLARIGYAPAEPPAPTSHPTPVPALAAHWGRILAGFDEATAALRVVDRAGALEPMLARFAPCPIRVVLRDTESYAELARMLWHPVSLHTPAAAEQQAADLLARMAEAVPRAPSDPQVIAAEVADLLVGDIPFFATTPAHGRLSGPQATEWLPEQDLAADALARWRRADLALDRRVIKATLVTAYLNEGVEPGGRAMSPGQQHVADLDRRRRRLASALLGDIRDAALRAPDGTVTWIAPVLKPTGWSVQPLDTDLYGGLSGVAVLLAAYQRESAAGRADAVDGIDALLDATVRTLRGMQDHSDRLRAADPKGRPAPPGGYIGVGSLIWAWLTLGRWGAAPDGVERARLLADGLPGAITTEQGCDLLTGLAGAIVPLLGLSAVTGEDRWTRHAVALGEQVIAQARRDEGRARWPAANWPQGVGGFAHGSTGIGWALARLVAATGDERFTATARAAFAFEESLYDRAAGGWLDLREPGRTAATWCHGAGGIGICARDLANHGWPMPEDLLGRAAAAVERDGFGWNHTLCHGDLGSWELLDAALTAGCPPAGLRRQALDARVIGSLETNGPISGLARDTFSPGLLGGLGGVAYQLLRMNDDSTLPSVLALGVEPV